MFLVMDDLCSYLLVVINSFLLIDDDNVANIYKVLCLCRFSYVCYFNNDANFDFGIIFKSMNFC